MDPGAMAIIATFYNEIDVFLLIFVRILGFFIFLPILSSMNIPTQARLLLAFFFAILIFTSGVANIGAYSDTIISYFGLIVTEFLVGAFLGYMLMFVFSAALYAGQIIDYKMGFAMVNVMDPVSQIQVPIVGNLLYLTISAILVASGGLQLFIGAFFYTYQSIPIGMGNIIGNTSLAWMTSMILTNLISLGVMIALPIMVSMTVIDVALGIIVKAVPQMNIFVIGMPVKILIGMVLLFVVLVPSLGFVYDRLFETAISLQLSVTESLRP